MEKQTKTVSIVGGGIGGLTSAILLAKQGYKVSLYEKNECLGGRASILHKDGYTFDMGPSRYLMPDIFEEFFESIGEDIHEYLDLKQLSPSYRVFYGDADEITLNKKNQKNNMNIIVLHGFHDEANTWRRKRLGDRCNSQGISCYQPQCNHEHELNLEKDIESIIQQVGIENFHKGTIIIGYSLGGITAKHLINRIGIKINKLITVASSFPRQPEGDDKGEEELLTYRNTVLDFALLNSLMNKHIAIFSKDDPIIPYEKAIDYRSEYYPSSIILSYEGKGHFGKRGNVDSIPEILPFIVTNQIQITTYSGKICCNNVGLFGYNNTEEKIRNGALAVIKNTQTGKFLFQIKKKAYNVVTLCGGGVEEGESCEETIIREIKEETGLMQPKIITKLGDSTYLRYRKGDVNFLGTNDFYYVEVDSDTTDYISPEEQDVNGIIWLDEHEALQSISFYSHLIGWFRYKEWVGGKNYDKADNEFKYYIQTSGFGYSDAISVHMQNEGRIKGTSLQHIDIYADSKRMSDIFESMEPGAGKQFLTFLDRAKIQYEIGMEFCKKNYNSMFDFFRRDIMRKGIKLNIRTTIDHYVARFFKNQLIRKIMQYTTVFLGTAPRSTPALYNIMSHCDFNMGVRYPKGGLHEIAKALHTIGLKYGVEYHLNTEIVGCEIKNNQISSLQIKQKKKEVIVLNFYDQSTWQGILSKQKTIETRALNPEEPDKYFGNIGIGDTITFLNKVTSEQMTVVVRNIYKWKNFEELRNEDPVVVEKMYSNKEKYKSIQNIDDLKSGWDFIPNYIDKIERNGLVGREFEIIDAHPDFKMQILIINNNSQHIVELGSLIERLGYGHHTIKPSDIVNIDVSQFMAVILSGGSHIRPVCEHPEDYDDIIKFVQTTELPVIGICLGAQIIAYGYGAYIHELDKKIEGTYQITPSVPNPVCNKLFYAQERHQFSITQLPSILEEWAHSSYGIEGFKHKYKQQFGLQFHPEITPNNQDGDDVLANILQLIQNGSISHIISSDIYLINADMAWFETNILPKEVQTYPKSYRDKKIFAPSGFIIYAGINKKLPSLDHHNLYFCEDRDKNFGQIFDTKELPEDPSIYVSKITHSDPTMAPEGCENLFVLVPIPNGIEITDTQKEQYKNMVRKIVEQMAGEEIVGHIDVEEVFTVEDFKSRYNSWNGTALGLAHPIMQTAVFRPNNISKKLDNLFYVGHNTNPGIGVPMVIISAQLALQRILKKFSHS